MTDKEKLKEVIEALQWVVSEFTFIGYGRSKAVREAKDVLERIQRTDSDTRLL